MEKVRIGIIGLGVMGTGHANYLTRGEIPGAELTAICDIDPARLKFAGESYGDGIKLFDSNEAFFADAPVDAVLVATPHYDHPPLVIRALERGWHALTEKPAGVYTRQVREMNEAAQKSDRIFGIMFQQRTTPVFQKLRELIQGGELGEIRRTNWLITNWFRSQSYYNSGGWRATWAGEGGGVLINQCPHNLDLWQWTCGMPKRVRAFCSFGKYHEIEVEDDVTAYVEYENGATGLFITTTGEAPGTNRFEVAGDRGKIVVEGDSLKFWRNRVPTSQFNREFTGGFGAPECWTVDVPVRGKADGHAGITRNFVQAILKGSPLLAPGEEGIKGLSLSNAMLLSTWTNDWVDLPIDEQAFLDQLQQRIKASTYKKGGGKQVDMDLSKSF